MAGGYDSLPPWTFTNTVSRRTLVFLRPLVVLVLVYEFTHREDSTTYTELPTPRMNRIITRIKDFLRLRRCLWQSCWTRTRNNSTSTSLSLCEIWKASPRTSTSFNSPRKGSPRPSTQSSSPRRPLAENEYSMAGPLDRWTEHWTQNTSYVKVKEMASSFRSILQKEHA